MTESIYITLYSRLQRLFHLGILVTFLLQAATGSCRLFITTNYGKSLSRLFGGYEMAGTIHFWGGVLMIACFMAHVFYILIKIEWRNLKDSLLGPDSLIPNLEDARHLIQQILYFFGIVPPPRLNRWAYYDKFAYLGVFWGIPLLGITGIMLRFPLITCRLLPGWTLNVVSLLHSAEAILAAAFIFIVHFFAGHLRPSNFPMNEAMFSGSALLEVTAEEKQGWVERLEKEGKLEDAIAKPPALWYRVLYFIFGYTALGIGIYLLISGIIYGRHVGLH